MPIRDGGGSADDMVSVWRAVVEVIGDLRRSLLAIFGTRSTTGLFTMTAAATLVVPSTAALAGSVVVLQAVDATAAALQAGADALYVDRAVTVAGVSFTVKTASGSPAAGGQFSYVLFNPSA